MWRLTHANPNGGALSGPIANSGHAMVCILLGTAVLGNYAIAGAALTVEWQNAAICLLPG